VNDFHLFLCEIKI